MTSYAHQMAARLADELPGLDAELANLYLLLALTRGTETTLRDVHDAWSVWRMNTRPDHPSLIPFEDLSAEVQQLDAKYRDAIHRATKAAK